MTQIPVISINLSGLEENPGFKITPDLAIRLCYAAEFGDIMMKCIYRMRPYEQKKWNDRPDSQKWEKICIDFISSKHLSHTRFKQICRTMIRDFDHIPITNEKKPRVGIVGEILVKFLPAANNHLAELLESRRRRAGCAGSDRFLLLLLLQYEFQGRAPWIQEELFDARKYGH